MVQQTLDATKNFIFDVRPMVLDDLGLVPTLRRSARDRGRRAHVPVEFDSMGPDRRLPMDVESTVFRVLDEALAAYLALGPEKVRLRLDWTDELEARLSAERTAALPEGEPLPEIPSGDVPDPIRQMIQDRHDARDAPSRRPRRRRSSSSRPRPGATITERAGSIGAGRDAREGGELRLVVPLPPADDAEARRRGRGGRAQRARPVTDGRRRRTGPGSWRRASSWASRSCWSRDHLLLRRGAGGQIGVLVDAAHGGP